jgi:hypothetical protein
VTNLPPKLLVSIATMICQINGVALSVWLMHEYPTCS